MLGAKSGTSISAVEEHHLHNHDKGVIHRSCGSPTLGYPHFLCSERLLDGETFVFALRQCLVVYGRPLSLSCSTAMTIKLQLIHKETSSRGKYSDLHLGNAKVLSTPPPLSQPYVLPLPL